MSSSSLYYDADYIKSTLDSVVLWRYQDPDACQAQLNIRLPKAGQDATSCIIIVNLVKANNNAGLTIDSVIIDVVSPSLDGSSFSGYRGGDVLMCPIQKHA